MAGVVSGCFTLLTLRYTLLEGLEDGGSGVLAESYQV